MTITPQSNIKLCTTKLEKDYKHSLTWNNKQAQTNYFNNLNGYIATDYTYVKKDNIIRVDKNIDELINYNYLIYTNNGFTTRTYYCFITNMEYLSENCTAITFETDVIQTYYFDIEYKKSFVEREHVNEDTIGLHTIPENLETGEYIVQNTEQTNYTKMYFCLGVTEDIITNLTSVLNPIYNGIVSGLIYIVGKRLYDVCRIITKYNEAGKSDAIYTIFAIPEDFTLNVEWQDDGGTAPFNIVYGLISQEDAPYHITNVGITKPSALGYLNTINPPYTPRNNKLLTFPYIYLQADNNAGTCVTYNYELFETISGEVRFSCEGNINPGCSIKYIPKKYKGVEDNYNESFNGAKLPLGGWITDPYVNWLTQNGVNNTINWLNAGRQIITGNFIEGAGTIANILSEHYKYDLMPNQANGNTNTSDFIFSSGYSGATFYQMSIKEEYAKIIDSYFDYYGYKVNEFKVPQFNSRENWNYIKLVESNIEGAIPQNYIVLIKQIFNNGITFWHNPATMLDYTKSNNII